MVERAICAVRRGTSAPVSATVLNGWSESDRRAGGSTQAPHRLTSPQDSRPPGWIRLAAADLEAADRGGHRLVLAYVP
jgi:hypothetical protein